MDELDKLKTTWSGISEPKQFSKQEINKMLHGKSRSIIKWVFIISVIELLVGVCFSIAIPLKVEDGYSVMYSVVLWGMEIISYCGIVYFVYGFFVNYRHIKNTSNVNEHIESIVKTRRLVELYIKFNIYLFGISTLFFGFEKVLKVFQEKPFSYGIFYAIFFSIVLFFVFKLVLRVMKFYYRVIYQRLVSKLQRNKEELIEIE